MLTNRHWWAYVLLLCAAAYGIRLVFEAGYRAGYAKSLEDQFRQNMVQANDGATSP